MRPLACSLLALLAVTGCDPGLDAPPAATAEPIWNGDPTDDFPAVGALTWDGDTRCTVTLIAPDVALTAAHCVEGLSAADIAELTVYLGPGAVGPLYGDLAVADALPHPEYNQVNADIALVFLADDAPVEPIWIWDEPMDQDAWIDTLIELVGYGVTDDDLDDAGEKRTTRVELYAFDEDVFFHYLGGTNACFGDSGGPALWYDDDHGRWWDLGVISALFPFIHEDQVCVGGGGYEIRVDLYRDWIAEHTDHNQEWDPGDDDDGGDGDGTLGDDGQGCQCGQAGGERRTLGTVPVLLLAGLLAARRR